VFKLIAIFLSLVLSASAQLTPETIVLKVGDAAITAAQFEAIVDALPAPLRSFAQGKGRKEFAEQLAQTLILAQEGYRRKLDGQADFEYQSKYRVNELMAIFASKAIQDSVKSNESELRQYYEAHQGEYEIVRARHILVRTGNSPVPAKAGSKELTAEAALAKTHSILVRLRAGTDFAALAASESDDIGSAAEGGDLGWFGRDQVAPEFEEAAFRLRPGELSEPVKTPFGYHVIQVQEHATKPLDEVKKDITEKLLPQKLEAALTQLRARTPIEYNSLFFGSPQK
jgi:peptidyl-prolyl cis-trans isomerase C